MLTKPTRMRMMRDAGYIYPEPWQNYGKCVDFIKSLLLFAQEDDYEDLRLKAEKLLKEIGE